MNIIPPPPPRSWCVTLLCSIVVGLFVLPSANNHVAFAQKPKLKRLEYNRPGDSLISCGRGPYWIEDTVELKPGLMVRNDEVYCRDCWHLNVFEPTIRAAEFLDRLGDTVEIEECEFLPELVKMRLKRLRENTGNFRLVRWTASANTLSPNLFYIVVFDEPVKAGSVNTFEGEKSEDVAKVMSISNVDMCVQLCIVPNDRVLDPRRTTEYLFHNGDLDNFFPATAHNRTRGWALYSVKAPMAWGITRGHEDVIIGGADGQNGCDTLNNIDLVRKESPTDFGNIRVTFGTSTAAALGVTPSFGNGTDISTWPLMSTYNNGSSSDHSMQCVTGAVAMGNNDELADPSNGPEGSSIGVSPECSGMIIERTREGGSPCLGYEDTRVVKTAEEAADIDLDFENNLDQRRAVVDVVYHPFIATPVTDVAVKMGIVMIGAVGNDRLLSAPVPSIEDPAAIMYMHPSNHLFDTKTIAVGALRDGELRKAVDCSPWQSPFQPPPVWVGTESFIEGWNYSPGTDKFNVSTDINVRRAAKRSAFVDIVAPSTDLWVVKNNERGYAVVAGTSVAAPLVAGVVGLMLSVSDHLGTPWDPITDNVLDPLNTRNGFDHQRRAYDILTFTADKVPDGNTAFPYTLQTNDRLQRHWAQRMGFGKVNAYRAVAHAVPLKANYAYTTSLTLPFDPAVTNPDGKMLMHMGARIHDGQDWVLADGRGPNAGTLDGEQLVIEYGGTNLPGEVYQNQGVTRINSANVNTRVDLTVPADGLLLIDGILKTTINTQSQNRVIATNQGSRIFMEGYLENIELVGALTIGDLAVDGTGLAPGLFFNRESDVYGTVRLENDAWCTISGTPDGKATRLRTGSRVLLNGNRNLMVKWGGILEMDHFSEVSTPPAQNRLLLVENGTLRVQPGAKVRLDAHVWIWDGQTFEIGDSAIVYIKDLTVNKGATFRVKPGAHVIFGSDDILINGHLDAQGGTTEERLRILFTPEINTFVNGNNTDCTFNPRDHRYMYGRTRLRVEGVASMPQVMESSATVTYSDFRNVSLELKNVRTEPFEYNRFTANSAQPLNMPGNVWAAQPHMLRYESDKLAPGLPPSFYRLEVHHSTFADVSTVAPPLTSSTITEDYLLRGIRCINGRRAEVTHSSFTNLAQGIWIQGTPGMPADPNGVEDNVFMTSDNAMLLGDGAFRVCNNTTTTVKLPVNAYNCGLSRYFDNTFTTSRVAMYFNACQTQALRNNRFANYWTGIMSNGTIVSLTSLREAGFTSPIQAYGRNTFGVVNPAPYQPDGMGHPNPFTNRTQPGYAQDVMLLSDLHYNDAGAQFLIKCGYNAFSEFATWHLSAPWNLIGFVDGSFNNFNPNAIPRDNNVVVTGNPWNVSDVYQPLCAIDYDPQSCTSFNLDGTPVQVPGKQALLGTTGDGRDAVQTNRMEAFVFEQATTSFGRLQEAIRSACRGARSGSTYELQAISSRGVALQDDAALYNHLQSASRGVYSLRVYHQNTGTCSVFMLVIQ